MMRYLFPLILLARGAGGAWGQWEIQHSGTDADFRGVASVSKDVAWVSGTKGTVVRTVDGGRVWRQCATPPDAERLDFRGVQAVDENTALVMSAGPGALSRVYQTTDGCISWRLLFTNPDADGFWDAILYDARRAEALVLGDPVNGSFVMYRSGGKSGRVWSKGEGAPAVPGQAAFAASNSILRSGVGFVTGGSKAELIHEGDGIRTALPFAAGESSGAFSMAVMGQRVVVVGGDYKQPGRRAGTAAFSTDGGYHFAAVEELPGGYRSAVAYEARKKVWIAVGPNGTDVSRDGGRRWRPLGLEKDWNALSLPYAVGPRGRIGKLRGI